MCTGEDKQLEAFARFVKLTGLRPNLERKDWTGFAKRYNGPGYAQNHYDKNWKRLIGDLRSRKRYALMGIDFCFVPGFMPCQV